jgi:hypothetical protein
MKCPCLYLLLFKKYACEIRQFENYSDYLFCWANGKQEMPEQIWSNPANVMYNASADLKLLFSFPSRYTSFPTRKEK